MEVGFEIRVGLIVEADQFHRPAEKLAVLSAPPSGD